MFFKFSLLSTSDNFLFMEDYFLGLKARVWCHYLVLILNIIQFALSIIYKLYHRRIVRTI